MEEKVYRIEEEGGIKKLVVDASLFPFFPSLEDSPEIFRIVIDALLKEGVVNEIDIVYDKILHYNEDQTSYINDWRNILFYLLFNKKIISYAYNQLRKFSKDVRDIGERLGEIKYIIYDLAKSDPIGAYLYTKRLVRKVKIKLKTDKNSLDNSFYMILLEILNIFEKSKIISKVKDKLIGYRIGDRKIYRKIFKPVILPNFVYTQLQLVYEEDYKPIEEYFLYVDGFEVPVRILESSKKTQYLYYIVPPEFQLDVKSMDVLNTAREILAKLKYLQRVKDIRDVLEFRRVMFDVSLELLIEIAKEKNYNLSIDNLRKLARILTRLTAGFGIIEVILYDKRVEDIYINPPHFETKLFLKHSDYGECKTNIILTGREIEGWITRFRLYSGRPLDEAHPILDTELITEEHSARVAVVQKPFSPHGYGIAIRKHRKKPWTLPLLVFYKSLNSFSAALLWFLVENGRSILIAGTRGAGKTSLMTATMLSIPRKHRIITIEDTLEIPFYYFKKLGFNILSLKVRSAVAGESGELPAEAGIRTSLRLGDSALIIGEVRSREAISLYEAMRVGAMANAVLGTIHAESPQGLFDRVVNDLGVPKTSFKATDIIVIVNKLRSPDLTKEYRRVIQITEVRKHWKEDPMLENAFVDLVRYNPGKDDQEPTDVLLEGESEVIKSIMSRVREWFGRYDRVWVNLKMREWFINTLIELAKKYKNFDILEADFVVDAYDIFRKVSGKYKFDSEEEIELFKKEVVNFLENEIKGRFV